MSGFGDPVEGPEIVVAPRSPQGATLYLRDTGDRQGPMEMVFVDAVGAVHVRRLNPTVVALFNHQTAQVQMRWATGFYKNEV